MGYESKLYVGDYRNGYFAEIARIDMCKMNYNGPFHKLLSSSEEIDKEYVWADDGNTKITEDRYGEKLRRMSVLSVISSLSEELEVDTYRRLKPALTFLESLLSQQEEGTWDNIIILHFGY